MIYHANTFPAVTLPKFVPGVTRVLSFFADKSGIEEWRKSVGEEEATRIVTESQTLGKDMHWLLESAIVKPVVTRKVMPMARLFAKKITDNCFAKVSNVYGVEVPFQLHYLYKGYVDCVADYNGIMSIIDYKNCRSMKSEEMIEDYFQQCAAYALGLNEVYNANIEQIVLPIISQTGQYVERVKNKIEMQEYTDRWLQKVEKYHEAHPEIREAYDAWLAEADK